jgi:L-2,4-diaminobutyrate transaminase
VLESGSDKYGPFAHGYTYSAHPLSAAAALVNLDILERENITSHVAAVGPHLLSRLKDAFQENPFVAEVRGAGLLAAVEFAEHPATRRRFKRSLKLGPQLAAAALEEGVIVRSMPHGDTLGFAPPLIITAEEIDDVVKRVKLAVDKVIARL